MDKKIYIIITSILTFFLFLTIILEIKTIPLIILLSIIILSILFYKNWIEHSVELGQTEFPAIFIDRNGNVIFQNKSHKEFFGFSDEFIIGNKDPTIPEHITTSIITREKSGIDLWVKAKNFKGENLDILVLCFKERKGFIIFKIPIGKGSPIFSKFMEAEKLASIGSIASGLAHQLNTPLGTILLTAQMLKEEIEKKEIKEEIEIIESQVKFCQDLVKKLLFLSKPSEEEEKEFNLNEVIKEVAGIFEKVFQKKNIKLKFLKSNEKEAIVYGKKNEIAQVFMNLFSNSIDAMENGGEIKVTSFITPFDRVIVKVQDTGKGIPPEYADRIFEPFFTTKPAYKGTGLGLSIVKRIVESHRGVIKLMNEGKGATFLIILPLSKNA
ncbi:MAG: ATP-binding protein [candidate division WOR-3 bacterium]